MVPSNECYSFGIPDLQCEQQEECFDRVKTPINEIAFSAKVWDERSVLGGNGYDGAGGGRIRDGVIHVKEKKRGAYP
jgi:hypothetical protein